MATNSPANIATAASGTVLQGQGVGTANAFSTATYPATTTVSQVLYSSATNVVSGLATVNSGILATNGSGVPAITTASGNWLNTSRCAFFAYNTTNPQNVTGDGTNYTVVFDTELFDQGSNFASNTFTAPVTGLYQLNVGVLGLSLVSTMTATLQIVATGITYTYGNIATTVTGNYPMNFSVFVRMTAADTATINYNVASGTKVVDVYGGANDPRTFFSGFLVC